MLCTLRINFIYFLTKSLTTSLAMISPATDGTNATLPGVCLLLLKIAGGAVDASTGLVTSGVIGVIGISLE